METATFDSFLDCTGKRRINNPGEAFVQASYVFAIDLTQVRGDELGGPSGDFLHWLRRERAENEGLDTAIRAGEILADDDGLYSGRHCTAHSFRLATEAVATYLATHGTGRGALEVGVEIGIADMDGEKVLFLTDDEEIDNKFFHSRIFLARGRTWTLLDYAHFVDRLELMEPAHAPA